MCGVSVYVRTIIRIHQEDEKCRDREEEDLEQCFQNALIATPLPPPPPSIPSIEFPAVATRQEWTTPAGSFSEWSAV